MLIRYTLNKIRGIYDVRICYLYIRISEVIIKEIENINKIRDHNIITLEEDKVTIIYL